METKNGFCYVYPEGYSKEDFNSRISGAQLMERWRMSLPEIRALFLSAFREESALDKIESQETGLSNRFARAFLGRQINLNHFQPTRTADMQDCFYLLYEVEKIEKDRPEIINTPLTKKEAYELGKLRKEQNKVDMYLQAAVDIGLWCNDVQESITRKMLVDKIQGKYPEITKKVINKHFWQAVPKELRHPGDHIKQS